MKLFGSIVMFGLPVGVFNLCNGDSTIFEWVCLVGMIPYYLIIWWQHIASN